MGLNIIDESGKKKIHIDDTDQDKDTVVVDGEQKNYNEVANAKEKEAQKKKKDDEETPPEE